MHRHPPHIETTAAVLAGGAPPPLAWAGCSSILLSQSLLFCGTRCHWSTPKPHSCTPIRTPPPAPQARSLSRLAAPSAVRCAAQPCSPNEPKLLELLFTHLVPPPRRLPSPGLAPQPPTMPSLNRHTHSPNHNLLLFSPSHSTGCPQNSAPRSPRLTRSHLHPDKQSCVRAASGWWGVGVNAFDSLARLALAVLSSPPRRPAMRTPMRIHTTY